MLSRHGWKPNPSPRRGFTVIAASRELIGSPVVVAVDDSAHGVRLFRSALDEAINRSCDLLVLDYGITPLRDQLAENEEQVDPREQSSMRVLSLNPHVKVVRIEPRDASVARTLDYCESVSASMLILGAEHLGSQTVDPTLIRRLLDSDFDVLVVTDHPGQNRPENQAESLLPPDM